MDDSWNVHRRQNWSMFDHYTKSFRSIANDTFCSVYKELLVAKEHKSQQ